MSTAVLFLDAEWRPLRVESWKRAICDVITGKTEVVEYSKDKTIQGVSQKYPMPSVVRVLKHFKRDRIRLRFSRLNIYVRDAFTCFISGTRVLMADGRQLPIENVRSGDRVIDGYGNAQTVLNTGNRIADNIVEIKHRGSFEKTMVTGDHPFLNSENVFVPINSFPEFLVFPRKIIFDYTFSNVIDTGNHLPQDKWYRYNSGRIYFTKRSREHGFPASFTMSNELSELFGIYCADGSSTDQGLVCWSLNTTTKKCLVDFVVKTLKVFGLPASVDEYCEKHLIIVRTGSKLLTQILRENCGRGAKNKKVPYDLIGKYHISFLRGVFAGDAHFDHNHHKIAYTSVSYELIFGLQSLLWGVGIFPTVQCIKREGRLTAWTLVLNARNYSIFMNDVMNQKTDDGEKIFGNEGFVFRRLEEVKKIEGEFVVYNIEVENTNSFIANGLSVHNCQYCAKEFMSEDLTFDHVVPRARGGRTTWENIVACCVNCNVQKADRTVEESGLELISKPRKPSYLPTITVRMSCREIPEEWRAYWSGALES